MNENYRKYLMVGEEAGSRYALSPPAGAPMGLSGIELGSRAGSSVEFKDHREYRPGDDLRRIDWSVYARSDKLTVKLFREEVTPHLDLVIDVSRSMDLEDTAKAEALLGLAAAFTAAADNAHFTHTAWLAAEGVRPVSGGSDRASAWEDIDCTWRGTPPESFEHLPPAWRPRGVRVFLSDLLFMGEPRRTLDWFADGAASVVVVQLLARADVEPPDRGNVRLYDAETEEMQEVFIDAVAEREYRDALARHQENWNRDCRGLGAVMTTLVAEDLLRTWDLGPLVAAEVLEVE